MTKLSDYVIDFIYRQGVKDIFLLSGGGCMHLIDSVGKHGKINYICNLHEQACAMAAEGYAKDRKAAGACLVTTGPGATNAITGLIGSWLDSAPVLFISGQVKRELIRPDPELRQLGEQEINIIDMVRPVSKYAVTVIEPEKIRYHLEKAVFLATHGRPGPVWLDIPLDVQAAQIDENILQGFEPPELNASLQASSGSDSLESAAIEAARMICESKRPVIIAGKGIRIAGAEKEFRELAEKLKIPVICSFGGYDLMEFSHPLNFGGQGIVGPRAGNLITQNSDLLICIGTRLNIKMVGYNYAAFARTAKKIVVDIDPAELRKPTIIPDLPIAADAKDFLCALLSKLNATHAPSREEWLDYCRRMKEKYPVVKKEHYKTEGYADIYAFVDFLSDAMEDGSTLALSSGFARVVPYQAFKVKKNQRIIANAGCASMGYSLPAAIGACLASGKKDVACLAGDGSIQMNMQELQTIKHYGLPIKIFVLNNNGYLSIMETQRHHFQGRLVASCPDCGVSLPDMGKIAHAYDIPYFKIENDAQLPIAKDVLRSKGAAICEVMLSPERGLEIKASSRIDESGRIVSGTLENQLPFLSEGELRENMLIPLWGEKRG